MKLFLQSKENELENLLKLISFPTKIDMVKDKAQDQKKKKEDLKDTLTQVKEEDVPGDECHKKFY